MKEEDERVRLRKLEWEKAAELEEKERLQKDEVLKEKARQEEQ